MKGELHLLQSCELLSPGDQKPARHRLRRIARQARVAIARVIGVPDYESYLAHMAAAHPGSRPQPIDEFTRERMNLRYSRPGSRCC